jgi:hypothetical protein
MKTNKLTPREIISRIRKLSHKRRMLMQEYYYSLEEAARLRTDEALDRVFMIEKQIRQLDSEIQKLRLMLAGELNDRKSDN